jgi:hypothetical protein
MAAVALAVALSLVLGPAALACASGAWVRAVRPEWECRLVRVWRPGPGGWDAQVRPAWVCRMAWVWGLGPGR